MADQIESVRQYIDSLPDDVQDIIIDVRAAILQAIPGAEEQIAYGMPMVTLGGKNLMSYAAWKKHVGVYPIPAGDDSFQERIAPYGTTKSTAQFPLSSPIPLGLISEMATLLAQERAPA
jgi:uncharacterized protein YdhG (YjbR/CyaY superfamily)